MGLKFIAVICLAIILSGCIGGKTAITPTPTPTPAVTTAQATQQVTPTPEVTPTGNSMLVKLDSRRGFNPAVQTIRMGDEVVWDNTEVETITLVSMDGLFDPQVLAYGRPYRYIFKKTGTYGFYLEKNKDLNGTITVGTMVEQTPLPTTPPALPPNPVYVDAQILRPAFWSPGNYSFRTLKVQLFSQRSTPLSIKAQIVSDSKKKKKKSFVLESEGSSYQFTNERQHFINSTNVTLRLLISGYQPIDYPFKIVDRLG